MARVSSQTRQVWIRATPCGNPSIYRKDFAKTYGKAYLQFAYRLILFEVDCRRHLALNVWHADKSTAGSTIGVLHGPAPALGVSTLDPVEPGSDDEKWANFACSI